MFKNKYLNLFVQPLITILILIIGLFIYGKTIGTVSISPNNEVSKRTFEVEGVGKSTVIPNKFQTEFMINETGATQKETQNKGNDKQNKAIDELTKLGFDKKDIKTTGYYINPNYDYTTGRTIIGYGININTQVTSSDVNKINSAIDKLTEIGINVGGLSTSVDDEEKFKTEARQKAVENAKKKAESLAKAGNFKLGKIASIKETEMPGDIRPMPLFEKGVAMPAQDRTDIQPGSTELTSRVDITYYIRD